MKSSERMNKRNMMDKDLLEGALNTLDIHEKLL